MSILNSDMYIERKLGLHRIAPNRSSLTLRLDNTGALAIEVYPSLLCNRVSEHVDLYIKLKLVIFSFTRY